jgi:uncharacterized membrane protein
MDELVAKQLTRQLKILNRWLIAMTTLFVLAMVIIGILLFKIITFVHDTRDRITDVQQKADNALDVKGRFCGGNSSFIEDRLCK